MPLLFVLAEVIQYIGVTGDGRGGDCGERIRPLVSFMIKRRWYREDAVVKDNEVDTDISGLP